MTGVTCRSCGSTNVGAVTNCLICGAALVAPPAPALAAWQATHIVGADLLAWAQPDAAAPPETTLPPGVQLQVVRTQGPWAEVKGWNGWSGWVDASRLQPVTRG